MLFFKRKKTKTIGVELNHVVRNINANIMKYYQKDFHPESDIDDIDTVHENVLQNYVDFSDKDLEKFLYEDYSYEVFGCSDTVKKNLSAKVNLWQSYLEENNIRLVFFSRKEIALTIQSTFFFLSKMGFRIRKVLFPKSFDEVYKECDTIITSDAELLRNAPRRKKKILILANGAEETDKKGIKCYNSLEELINENMKK